MACDIRQVPAKSGLLLILICVFEVRGLRKCLRFLRGACNCHYNLMAVDKRNKQLKF